MPTIESHYGAYIIRGRGHGSEGTLVQTDWEYPRWAEDFGWSLRRVQKRGKRTAFLSRIGKGCDHRSTDGTVDCRECGVTASEFIHAAGEFLDSKC